MGDNMALSVLDRALRGDSGALSFLERTASIYVLDATNPSHPKTYGCWDFLNQALNEIERHELQPPQAPSQQQPPPQLPNLSPHVQLLTSLSRRAARRPPPSDRSLIRTCLTNAAQSGAFAASEDVARSLVDLNCQTRERVMGRIAALAFDFSLHTVGGYAQQQHRSAFADPLAMEGLCTIVAANSVSSGPGAFRHLVMDWIVPSVDGMPLFAVAAVAAHCADEATGRAAPAGTGDALKQMFEPVVSGVLAPTLADAVRESDVGEGGGEGGRRGDLPTRNQRLAAMVLRAMERWCAAAGAGILQITRVCALGTKSVNIIEVFSDSLYSDAEIVIDAAAELFDTLLRRNSKDDAALKGMDIVSSLLGSVSGLETTQSVMRDEERERDEIMSELVSAIGLQRFRFASASQSEGAAGVCRCLVRIAAAMAVAAQASIRSGQLGDSADGLMELMLKAAAHPSVHVCGIALEALPYLITSGTDFSVRLLPVLQQRAIVPSSLRGAALPAHLGQAPDCGVDFHEYASFRDNLLSAALVACYRGNRSFFMESCAAAVDEFCSTAAVTTPQLPFQLEAALFCLGAVSSEASKRACLVGASPAAQAAAAKACAQSRVEQENVNVAEDARRHDEELARCVAALSRSPGGATSNPLTLAQMCHFMGVFANWLSKTRSPASLDNAAQLVLKSFNLASAGFANDAGAREMISEMSISPIAEAATALRNILTRSPGRFATPQALTALGSGWESSYTSANSGEQTIKIEDREALCSGLCRVLAALPSDQWTSSLTSLAQPTVDCLEQIVKTADQIFASTPKSDSLTSILVRVAHEIRLLVVMTRAFNSAATSSNHQNAGMDSKPPAAGSGGPSSTLIAVLQRPWPCLTHVSQRYNSFEPIASALGDLLTSAVQIQGSSGSSLVFFKEICDMAANIMLAVRKNGAGSSHGPMLFVREAVDVYGHLAEADVCALAPAESSPLTDGNSEIRAILERLLMLSFEAVQASAGELWSHAMEQGNGEQPMERSRDMEPKKQVNKSPDEISAMFLILDMCVTRCPVLLVRFSTKTGNEQDDQTLFVTSVDAAMLSSKEKESDVAKGAMVFLKSLIEMRVSSDASSQRIQLIGAAVDASLNRVRRGLILSLVSGICGNVPRNLIEPSAALLSAVLKASSPQDAEALSVAALNQEQFRMGDEAKTVSLHVLGSCARGTCPFSTLMDLADDLWQLHQCDDTGAVAGGDEVIRFAQKYRIQR